MTQCSCNEIMKLNLWCTWSRANKAVRKKKTAGSRCLLEFSNDCRRNGQGWKGIYLKYRNILNKQKQLGLKVGCITKVDLVLVEIDNINLHWFYDRRTTDVWQCQGWYHVVDRISVLSILSRLVDENEEVVCEWLQGNLIINGDSLV